MEITPSTKLPVKLFYNWAKIRTSEHRDKSPIALAILSDEFFTTAGSDEPGESSLYHIIANYWQISPLNPKDSKLPATQHIPLQYLKFLSAVATGQGFHDDALYLLFKHVGLPYTDLNGEPHYHYLIEPLSDVEPGQEPIQWRALPHLFPLLAEIEPFKGNLAKHRSVYISQGFFTTFLRIMPFLYWVAQAYTQSIQLTQPVQIKDSLEIDGKFAFGCLFEHTIKGYKDSALAQGVYDLVLIICQVLTHGSTLDVAKRSPFVHRLFQMIGDKKYISLTDTVQFLLCGDFCAISSLDSSELSKQTKGMAKRFHQSPWLTVYGVDQVLTSEKGADMFKEQFLQPLAAFEQLHDFLTSPQKAGDDCSIM